MSDEDLRFEVGEGIGLVSFNRPEARNALTYGMYDRLAEICGLAGQTLEMKVLILTGVGGKAFAAGTDIASFKDLRTAQDAAEYEQRIDRVLGAVERCRVPTIAAIAGACTGGGAAIAAACDLRLGTASLRFGFPIARTLGNCLSSASLSRLVALIGAARTRELIFTARLIEGEEAHRIGLVSELIDPPEMLSTRARELALTLAGHAPLTLRATKEALRRLRLGSTDDHDLVTLCYTSEDFREGRDAFLAKRKPTWKGR